MEIIKKLSAYIEEELGDAEKYARCAVKHKADHPTLAKTFYDLATDELRHKDLLHVETVRLIDAYRKEKGEPPAAMLAVYDYLHERQIDRAKEVKLLLEMYRAG